MQLDGQYANEQFTGECDTPETHGLAGVELREHELHASGYAPMSVEYRVWVCNCGSEFRDLRELKEHANGE